MAINIDDNGFILGQRRMAEGIESTRDNTAEILRVLTEQAINATKRQTESLDRISTNIEVQNKHAREADNRSKLPNSPRTRDSSNKQADTASPQPTLDATDHSPSSASERSRRAREQSRQANGRFGTEEKSFFKKLKGFFSSSDTNINADATGYDPTIDALKEVKDVVEPVGNVFGKMSAKAVSLFRGRRKKGHDDEALSDEETKANRRDEKSSEERNGLLKRLIKAVMNQESSGGLLGGGIGLLRKGGGLLKFLGKGVLKRLPILGALLGGGLLAKDWNSLDAGGKGKGIGELSGGAIGALIGSFLGPIGTVAGGGLGVYLGGIFGEKVGKWTESFKTEDFKKIFEKKWEAVTKFFSDLIPGPLKKAGGVLASPLVSIFNAANTVAKSGVGMVSNGLSALGSGLSSNIKPTEASKKAMEYFQAQGWTKEQSAGIVSNIHHESSFKSNVVGDGGKAYGLAQWHPDRQAEFKKKYGKDIRQSTFEEQLAFIHYELTQGNEQRAGNKLKNANSAAQAGAVISRHYERPLDQIGEANKRAATANKIANDYQGQDSKAVIQASTVIPATIAKPKTKTVPVVTTRANKTATGFKSPVITPVAMKTNTKPTAVVTNKTGNETIQQDVSDRGLAHIIRGGIGQTKI